MRYVPWKANRCWAERIDTSVFPPQPIPGTRVEMTEAQYRSLGRGELASPPGVPVDEWRRNEWQAGEFRQFETASGALEPDDVTDAWQPGLDGYVHEHPSGEQRIYEKADLVVNTRTGAAVVRPQRLPLSPEVVEARHKAAVQRGEIERRALSVERG